MFRLVLLSMALLGCTSCFKKDRPEDPPDSGPPPWAEALEEKWNTYLGLITQELDEFGWPNDSKCDGSIFAALARLAGVDINLESAREGGLYHRHPAKNCLENGESASQCSRDGYLALFHVAASERNLGLIGDVVDLGRSRAEPVIGTWVMCEGDEGRSSIYLPEQETLFDLREKLGGNPNSGAPIRQVYFCRRGFECHLLSLYIWLRARIHGGASAKEIEHLRDLVNKSPRNAIFSGLAAKYDNGNFTPAAEVLLDESLFPADRLPTSAERCTEYLWQRFETEEVTVEVENEDGQFIKVVQTQPNPDWLPCPEENKVHDGVDFLIAAALVLGKIGPVEEQELLDELIRHHFISQ